MKKRIVSILLCVVMLLCTIPISVSAAAVAPEGDTLTFTGLELYNDVLNVEGSTLYTNGGSGGGTSYTVDTTTYASENAISFNRKSNATRQWKTFNMNFASKYNASLAEYTYVVIKAKSPADTEYSGFAVGTNATKSVAINEYLMCDGVRDTWYIKVINLTDITTDDAENAVWDGMKLKATVSMISNAELVIGGFALCKNETAANAAVQGFKGANDFVLPDTTGEASVVNPVPAEPDPEPDPEPDTNAQPVVTDTSVTYTGDALWNTVVNAYTGPLETGARKLEYANGNIVYTQKTDNTTNVAYFNMQVAEAYREQYNFVAIKYKIDLSSVTEQSYSVGKLSLGASWGSATDLKAQVDGQWHIGASAFTWNDASYNPYKIQVNVAGVKTDVTDGKFAPAGLVIGISELVLFKTKDAMHAYLGADAPAKDTETGYVFDGDRLVTMYEYTPENGVKVAVTKADGANYATFTNDCRFDTRAQLIRYYIPLAGFDVTQNNYLVIKYRYNGADSFDNADISLMRVMKEEGSDSTEYKMTADNQSRSMIDQFETIADGEWHELIVDLRTIIWDGDAYMGATWSEHQLKGICLMPWVAKGTGETFDVEVLGFVADEDAAYEALGKEAPSDETDTDDVGTTDTDETDPEDTTPSATESSTTEAPEETGCKSSVGMSVSMLVGAVMAAGAVVMRKKRKE